MAKPRGSGVKKEKGAGSALWSVISVALLVSAHICLFGTSEIYFANRAEFASTYAEAMPLLLGACLGLAALLVVIGMLIRRRYRAMFCAVVLALAGLMWIQGGFLRWSYGEFDGRGIDWAKFSWQGWVDAAIWIGVLGMAVRFHRRFARHVSFVALAFVVIQAGVMASRTLWTHDASPVQKSGGYSQDGRVPQALCDLSSSRNVFHFIMDSFQTDVFLELVQEEGLAGDLDGFVLFKENMSVGRHTVLCIPAIFSGLTYDGTLVESEYFRKAMNKSFHNVLYAKNYAVNLMPRITMQGTRMTNYFPSPATYGTPRRARVLRTATFLIDVSMFRQFPHYVKRFIYDDENWRLSSLSAQPPSHQSFHQKAFFRDYISKLRIAYKRPAYHFMHLMPPHPPLVTLSDGTYSERVLPYTRENYKTEARYILRLFIEFLHQLQRTGLYDSSIILLQGDHGAGFAPIFDGKTLREPGRVAALLVLKGASERGPLRTSLAPSTIADVPATILDLLGFSEGKDFNPYEGESVVRLDPAKPRDREFVFLTNRSETTPILHHWMVRGSVFDSTAWRVLPETPIERKIRRYEWGKKLGFGIAGNGEAYLRSGWSTTSPTVHWSDGESAEMMLEVFPAERDVEVNIVFFPLIVPGKVDHQRIRMRVNGRSLGTVMPMTKAARSINVVVPWRLLGSGRMHISFEFPDAVSLAEIGAGRDTRVQAMGLYSFEAHLLPAPAR